MQPYQEASEEFNKQSYRPFAAAASVAVPVAKAAIGGRVMSMLNKYVPTDLAVKGLSKIDPRLGKFVSMGQEMGYSFDDLKSFMSQKMEKGEEQGQAKEQRNIVEQYSPELHQFILGEIQKGRKPLEAAAIATLDKTGSKSFKKAIAKITKDHNLPWSTIVEQVYGSGEKGMTKQAALSKFKEHQKKNSLVDEELARFQQHYGQQQAQAPQPIQPPEQQAAGQGQQALMAILQKINQRLGQ